ncbi:hypothetical protein [Winogradskyella sp.]|uniref:hypothetical protein n=1 Tax=Winogradskyella sp. TaxID=1883156 RepID=UPI00263081BF|nr:hypothetical protein [Winogradskyella sp.]
MHTYGLAETYMTDGNTSKSFYCYDITLNMLEKKEAEWIDHVKNQIKKLKEIKS